MTEAVSPILIEKTDDNGLLAQGGLALVNLLSAALIEAKRSMWIDARATWTMADFKNWSVVQQIDEALNAARAAIAQAQQVTHD